MADLPLPLFDSAAPSRLHAVANVESSAIASRATVVARASPRELRRAASLYFRRASRELVVALASDGVAFTARSDSPALLRSARASLSAASMRPRGPSPVSRN